MPMWDAILRVDYGALIKQRMALAEYTDCGAYESANGTPEEGAAIYCTSMGCPCRYDGQRWIVVRTGAGLKSCEID